VHTHRLSDKGLTVQMSLITVKRQVK